MASDWQYEEVVSELHAAQLVPRQGQNRTEKMNKRKYIEKLLKISFLYYYIEKFMKSRRHRRDVRCPEVIL